MVEHNRRKILKSIGSFGITGVGLGAISPSVAASPAHDFEIEAATGQQIQTIATNDNYRLNEEKAKKHGLNLSLGNAVVVQSMQSDDEQKFVVPFDDTVSGRRRHGRGRVNPSPNDPGYHARMSDTSVESILYIDDDDSYASGNSIVDGGVSMQSTIQPDIPGFTVQEVPVDEVCDELRAPGEDVICLGAVGYTTLLTLITKSIPYIGAAITALCALKSETCARWPRIYQNATGLVPGEGCSTDSILLYEAKWWNPLPIDYFMAPACDHK